MSTALAIADVLRIDPALEIERITARIREIVFDELRRKGAVVGISGGIDSSVVAFLCARALGPERVMALFTPEQDSSPDSLRLGTMVADALKIPSAVEDISPILTGARCYERRDAAIRGMVSDYGNGCKSKLVIRDVMNSGGYNVSSLVVEYPSGETRKVRLTAPAYLAIVAATNFKQRARKMMEYHYADLLQYAVAGTPNRLEYDQGFFVKNGDGSADFKPIAHLYKSQVYQLAEHLGVPEEIRRRPPTTDTFPMAQSQEEFYFALPLKKMDICLYARNHGISPADLAPELEMNAAQVERVYRLIDGQKKIGAYLNSPPVLI